MFHRSLHKSTSQVCSTVLQEVAAKAAIVAAVAALAAAAALHSVRDTRQASASGSLPPPAQPPSDAPALSPAHAATSRWARNHIDNLEQCCGCQVLNWRATSSSPVRYGHRTGYGETRSRPSKKRLSVRGAVVGAYQNSCFHNKQNTPHLLAHHTSALLTDSSTRTHVAHRSLWHSTLSESPIR